MDFKRLHGQNVESFCELPALPLPTTSLIPQQSHLLNSGEIQTPCFEKCPLSSCDSRKLTQSPFCDMDLTSLSTWQRSILETYRERTSREHFAQRTSGLLRLQYPNIMDEKELISALKKVNEFSFNQIKDFVRTTFSTMPIKRTLQL